MYSENVSLFVSCFPPIPFSLHLFPKPSTKRGETLWTKQNAWGFPGGTVVENLPANAGDAGSSPGLGGSHMPRSN